MTPTTPIADAIRAAIQDSCLTAYALGKRAGLAPQIISRWLSGERPDISLATAEKLAVALGVIVTPKKLSRKS